MKQVTRTFSPEAAASMTRYKVLRLYSNLDLQRKIHGIAVCQREHLVELSFKLSNTSDILQRIVHFCLQDGIGIAKLSHRAHKPQTSPNACGKRPIL
jgi:hypothetical protein